MVTGDILLELASKQDKYNRIHDSFYDVTGEEPTDKTIHKISEMLDNDIRLLAEKWGWDDTEVRDNVCHWIKRNYNLRRKENGKI